MPIFESRLHEDLMKPELNEDLDYTCLNDLFPEIHETVCKKIMSMRQSGIGKAPGAIQNGTHNANAQLSKLVVETVDPKRKSRSMKGKRSKGLYEAK